MLGTYEKMQKDFKIGPLEKGPDGIPRMKAFAEFPKLVKTGALDKKGKPIKMLVDSPQAELKARAFGQIEDAAPNPLVEEKNALAAEVASLQAELAQLRAGAANRLVQQSAEPFAAKVDPVLVQVKPVAPQSAASSLQAGPSAESVKAVLVPSELPPLPTARK